MEAHEIDITDYMRIIIGDVPWTFLIEVAIRFFFLYLLLLISMRLMGKRMAGIISNSEMAGLVSLAAAIGVPMLAPDRGILPSFIIAVIVVGVQRLFAYLSFKKKKLDNIIQGDLSVLVEDGRMLLPVMEKNRISQERLFAELRNNEISNLGKLRRVYLEAGGLFSLVKYDEAKPGLCLLPEWDKEFRERQKAAHGQYCCMSCGNVSGIQKDDCNNCGENCWTIAVRS